MVVAIKPSQFRGGIQTQGGIPESPLEALTNVLDSTIDLGVGIAGRVKDKELGEVEALLANPLLTESEILEIQRDAIFPLAKLKAENRRGSLIAERSRAAAVDALSKATDPVGARRVLRILQKETMDSEEFSDGVLAGIRERYAEFAPQLLADASARRVERRDRQEVVDLDADLTTSLETGILAFGNTLEGALKDEKFVVNGDLSGFFDNLTSTLENFYLRGDDNSEVNLHASRTFAAIDLVLESDLKLKPAERKKLTKLRQRMEDKEEAALQRAVVRGDDEKKRRFLKAGRDLATHQLNNRFGPPNDIIIEAGIEAAPSPAAAQAFLNAAHAPPTDPEATGVANSPIWAGARRNLITAFRATIQGQLQELTADQLVALDLFDGVAEALPSDLRKDRGKLQSVSAIFVREAIKKSGDLFNARLEREQEFNAAFKDLRAESAEAVVNGKLERAVEINLTIAKAEQIFLTDKRDEVITLWIADHGYVRTDLVNTHNP